MTLVHKAAMTVTIFAIANLSFAYAIKHSWIEPVFAGFEQRLAEKSMKQVAEAIAYTARQIDDRALDYASWDATYEYVLSGDPEYYEQNLGPGVLTDLGLDWLVIVDKSGKVVSGPIRDIETRELIVVSEFPQGQWEPTHPLLLGDTRDEEIAGVMVTEMRASNCRFARCLDEPSSRRIPRPRVVGRAMDDAFMLS